MISNRQNRRRGRGGQRGGNNRSDNRNRGNAAQLLEKYKSQARDAQMSGDRVQAEYYLQFADHYFRVLEEHRASQEDKQAHKGQKQQGRDKSDDEDRDESEKKPRRRSSSNGADKSADDDGQSKKTPTRRTRKKSDEPKDDAISADALPPAISTDKGEADAA